MMILLEFAVGLLEARSRLGKVWNFFTGAPYSQRGVWIDEDNEGHFALFPVGCDLGVAKMMVHNVDAMEIMPVEREDR